MKKVLSTVAALGLVAGLASTAAAVEFSMSGKYEVDGAYLNTVGGTPTATFSTGGVQPNVASTANSVSDAFLMHTFEIKPKIKVNDKVSMASVIRLADDTMWGQNDATGNNMSQNGNTSNVYLHQLYMDYASPIGQFRIGRTPAGTYGTDFMDFDQRGDRIMVYPSFLAIGPVTTLFYMQKSLNYNRDNSAAGTPPASDADNTSYVARVYYKTDALDSGLHYQFTNNKSDLKQNADGTWSQTLAGNPVSDQKQQLTAYGKFKMDNYFANAEVTHYFGSKNFDIQQAAQKDQDYDSWAGMIQVGAKINALTPSLMYFYAQGQDVTKTKANGGDITNALGTTGTGDQFEPLYILTGRFTGMLNNEVFNGNTANMSAAGVHAIVLAADYAVSNDLKLHGAIGWAKADENTYLIGAGGIPGTNPTATLNDSYGWEYNLGAAYKLLDNLTYEAHFGYLATGDYFNYGSAIDATQNIYILTHSLTMTF